MALLLKNKSNSNQSVKKILDMDFQQTACLNQQKAIDHYTKGNKNSLDRNFNSALDEFTIAIAFNPNFAEAYYRRGKIRLSLNDQKGAYFDFAKALQLDPRLLSALNSEGLTGFVGSYEGSSNNLF
jgi:tetratricopeptide (TPR) repeat protein